MALYRCDVWLPPKLRREDSETDPFEEAEVLYRAVKGPESWRGIARASRLMNEALERKRPLTIARRHSLLSCLFELIHTPDIPLFEQTRVFYCASALLSKRWLHGLGLFSSNEKNDAAVELHVSSVPGLEWRPLLALLLKHHHSKSRTVPRANEASARQHRRALLLLIHAARPYFPQKAALEVWRHCEPLLREPQRQDVFKGLSILWAFSPTDHGHYAQLLPHFLKGWHLLSHCPEWDFMWLSLLCRARKYAPEAHLVWDAAEPKILSAAARILGLQMGTGSQPGGRRSPGCYTRLFLAGVDVARSRLAKLAKLLVFLVARPSQGLLPAPTNGSFGEAPSSASDHSETMPQAPAEQPGSSPLSLPQAKGSATVQRLLRLLNGARVYFHPSNPGACTNLVVALLAQFTAELGKAAGWQVGSSEASSQSTSADAYAFTVLETPGTAAAVAWPPARWVPRLDPSDVGAVCDFLLPLLKQGVFSRDRGVALTCAHSLKNLACLAPLRLCEPLVDFIFQGLGENSVVNTHQFPASLTLLTALVHPLMAPLPLLAADLPALLELSLKGIDVNDQRRTMETLALYGTLLLWLPVGSFAKTAKDGGVSGEGTEDGGVSDGGAAEMLRRRSECLQFDETPEMRKDQVERCVHGAAALGGNLAGWSGEVVGRLFAMFSSQEKPTTASAATSGFDLGHHLTNQQSALIRAVSRQLFSQMDAPTLATSAKKVLSLVLKEVAPNALKDASFVVEGCAAADPASVVPLFLPALTDGILTKKKSLATDALPGSRSPSDVWELSTTHSTRELGWRLFMLRGACKYGGAALVPFASTLGAVIAVTVGHSDKVVAKGAAKVLRACLHGLTETYPTDYRSLAPSDWRQGRASDWRVLGRGPASWDVGAAEERRAESAGSDGGGSSDGGSSGEKVDADERRRSSSGGGLDVAWHECSPAELSMACALLAAHLVSPVSELLQDGEVEVVARDASLASTASTALSALSAARWRCALRQQNQCLRGAPSLLHDSADDAQLSGCLDVTGLTAAFVSSASAAAVVGADGAVGNGLLGSGDAPSTFLRGLRQRVAADTHSLFRLLAAAPAGSEVRSHYVKLSSMWLKNASLLLVVRGANSHAGPGKCNGARQLVAATQTGVRRCAARARFERLRLKRTRATSVEPESSCGGDDLSGVLGGTPWVPRRAMVERCFAHFLLRQRQAECNVPHAMRDAENAKGEVERKGIGVEGDGGSGINGVPRTSNDTSSAVSENGAVQPSVGDLALVYKALLSDLVSLSMGPYSTVRSKAQAVVGNVGWRGFAWVLRRDHLPHLIETVSESLSTYEQTTGAVHLLMQPRAMGKVCADFGGLTRSLVLAICRSSVDSNPELKAEQQGKLTQCFFQLLNHYVHRWVAPAVVVAAGGRVGVGGGGEDKQGGRCDDGDGGDNDDETERARVACERVDELQVELLTLLRVAATTATTPFPAAITKEHDNVDAVMIELSDAAAAAAATGDTAAAGVDNDSVSAVVSVNTATVSSEVVAETKKASVRGLPWRYQLVVSWSLLHLLQPGVRVHSGTWAWFVGGCLRAGEGLPLQKLGLAALHKLVSLHLDRMPVRSESAAESTSSAPPSVLPLTLEEHSEVVGRLLDSHFLARLVSAIIFNRNVQGGDAAAGGRAKAQWSKGVEELLREGRRLAGEARFPHTRLAYVSSSFKSVHARLIKHLSRLVGGARVLAPPLLRALATALSDPGRDLADERNTACAAAEIVAGLLREATKKGDAASGDGADADAVWGLALPLLETRLSSASFDFSADWADGIRFAVGKREPERVAPLVRLLVRRTALSLGTKQGGSGSCLGREGSAGGGGVGGVGDDYSEQAKWLRCLQAVVCEFSGFRRARGGLVDLCCDELAPMLVGAVLAHPYRLVREMAGKMLFLLFSFAFPAHCVNDDAPEDYAKVNAVRAHFLAHLLKRLEPAAANSDESIGDSADIVVAAQASLSTSVVSNAEGGGRGEEEEEAVVKERRNLRETVLFWMVSDALAGDLGQSGQEHWAALLPHVFAGVGDSNLEHSGMVKGSLRFLSQAVEGASLGTGSPSSSCSSFSSLFVGLARSSRWKVREEAAFFAGVVAFRLNFSLAPEPRASLVEALWVLLGDERKEVGDAAREAFRVLFLTGSALEARGLNSRLTTSARATLKTLAVRKRKHAKIMDVTTTTAAAAAVQPALQEAVGADQFPTAPAGTLTSPNAAVSVKSGRGKIEVAQVTSTQGLSALVLMSPFEVPPGVPQAIALLATLHSATASAAKSQAASSRAEGHTSKQSVKQSVAAAAALVVGDVVKATFMEFKRTHTDDWTRHREAFDEQTLDAFNDTFESPSYFC